MSIAHTFLSILYIHVSSYYYAYIVFKNFLLTNKYFNIHCGKFVILFKGEELGVRGDRLNSIGDVNKLKVKIFG
jgi:hypothetical protein